MLEQVWADMTEAGRMGMVLVAILLVLVIPVAAGWRTPLALGVTLTAGFLGIAFNVAAMLGY